ncbi:hypothetical protein N7481_012347 [Penicillium waksmanii]|uniref:uncharacterized protein n=1 Tax=Penicillium waksmanii TaxID=69791 RepID=UPI002546D63D|nr:uncharacterized protein N7481_012347 [Penicillium waksmanii]KAJ5965633.1 hypothetical protein N7481_012347 [Penicillium waksmanii]
MHSNPNCIWIDAFSGTLTRLDQTPSPFRLSRRQPSTRRGAGPQFSNSPRFLLSQSTPKKHNDLEIDDGDDNDAPASTARTSRTPAPSHNSLPQPHRQRDVIEDSDDDEAYTEEGILRSERDREEAVDDAINSTTPGEPATPGLLDEEFDAVFAPERDGKKRRRLETSERLSLESSLPPSSPEPRPRPPISHDSPAPQQTPSTIPREIALQGTPAPRTKFIGPGISTPVMTSTPFRSKPRFMLSTKKPPNTQPTFRGETPFASQVASPPERRKPTFILPRSPSPSAVAEDIPAPFSPSSRALRRRGRPRAGAETYAPGGMAAEVRSWILEMGSKRDAISTPALQLNQASGMKRYLLTVRVIHANQAVLSSSGPLALIQAEKIVHGSQSEGDERETIHIMIMGLPRSKPPSRGTDQPAETAQAVTIQTGDLLGIHQGLAWNLVLHGFQQLSSLPCPVEVPESLTFGSGASSSSKKEWLIAMEWDILEA